MTRPLDVITIGRSSVDLYGAQGGGRLEDMASFQKNIGGSPTWRCRVNLLFLRLDWEFSTSTMTPTGPATRQANVRGMP